MNTIGISSACYYPQLTETSFQKVCESGAKTAEIFFNAESELKPSFLRQLNDMRLSYGVEIASVHPFSSFTESNYLFSGYERRFWDTLPLYERFFEAANILGARIFVLHGIRNISKTADDVYFERFARLQELAGQYQVIFAQENVVQHRSESPEFLLKMKKALGGQLKTVFDLKQARRAGVDIYEHLRAVGDTICHVHISDCLPERDCVPPGEGDFAFARFFRAMNKIGYGGKYIIELYSNGYQSEEEIVQSLHFLQKVKHAVDTENGGLAPPCE